MDAAARKLRTLSPHTALDRYGPELRDIDPERASADPVLLVARIGARGFEHGTPEAEVDQVAAIHAAAVRLLDEGEMSWGAFAAVTWARNAWSLSSGRGVLRAANTLLERYPQLRGGAPALLSVLAYIAINEGHVGRSRRYWQDAVAAAEAVGDLDQMWEIITLSASVNAFTAGRFDDALPQLRGAMRHFRGSQSSTWRTVGYFNAALNLALSLLIGRFPDEALRVVRDARSSFGDETEHAALLDAVTAWALADLGRPDEAAAVLPEPSRLSAGGQIGIVPVARVAIAQALEDPAALKQAIRGALDAETRRDSLNDHRIMWRSVAASAAHKLRIPGTVRWLAAEVDEISRSFPSPYQRAWAQLLVSDVDEDRANGAYTAAAHSNMHHVFTHREPEAGARALWREIHGRQSVPAFAARCLVLIGPPAADELRSLPAIARDPFVRAAAESLGIRPPAMTPRVDPLGAAILRARGMKSRREFAASIGVTEQTIRNWERGHTRPSRPQHLAKLEATGVDRALLP